MTSSIKRYDADTLDQINADRFAAQSVVDACNKRLDRLKKSCPHPAEGRFNTDTKELREIQLGHVMSHEEVTVRIVTCGRCSAVLEKWEKL